jgi:lipoprotein-anchoring transpeptidase ErfK/SrfK
MAAEQDVNPASGTGRTGFRAAVRPWRLPLAVVAILLGLVAAAWAYDQARGTVIPDGVHTGPVKLGGLSAAAAHRQLAALAARHEHQPLLLIAGDQRLTVVPAKLGIKLDVDSIVNQAIGLKEGGNFISRDVHALTGSTMNADIAPEPTSGSQTPIGHLAQRLQRQPHPAAVDAGPAGLRVTPDQAGIAVDPQAVRLGIASALLSGDSKVVLPAQHVPASVTVAELKRRYRSYVTIDRGQFRLRVYQDLKLTRSYPIAVGMQGLETPAGLYHIQNKVVDPAWDVPNSSWAGSLAGQHIPPGPDDPLKARWMGLFNGAGIHGTDETDSIGSYASHGCVRMLIPDVIDLYDRVQVGTPVYIGD